MHPPRPTSAGELASARGHSPSTPLSKPYNSPPKVSSTVGATRRLSAGARPFRPSPLGGPALSYTSPSLSDLSSSTRSKPPAHADDEGRTQLRASQRSKSDPDTRAAVQDSSNGRRRSVVFALDTPPPPPPPVPAMPGPSRLSLSSSLTPNESSRIEPPSARSKRNTIFGLGPSSDSKQHARPTPENSDPDSKVQTNDNSASNRAELGTDAPTFTLNVTPPDAHPDDELEPDNDTLSPLSASSCTSSSSSGHGDLFLSFQPHRHLPARPSILKQASASSLAEARESLAERLSVRSQSASASVRIGLSASEFGALRSRRPTSMIVSGDNNSSRSLGSRLAPTTAMGGSQKGGKSEWMFEVPTPRFSREGVYTRGIVMPMRKVDYDKRSSMVANARPRTMESQSPASGTGPFRGVALVERHSLDSGVAASGIRKEGQDGTDVRLRSISTGGNANVKAGTTSRQVLPVTPTNNALDAATNSKAPVDEQQKAPKLREKKSNKSLRNARSFSNGFSLSKRWHWPGGGHDNDGERGRGVEKESSTPVVFPSLPGDDTNLPESAHNSSESVRPRTRSKSLTNEPRHEPSRKDEDTEKKTKKRRPLSGGWGLRFSRSSRVFEDNFEVQVTEPEDVPPVPPLLPTHIQKTDTNAQLRPRVSMSESGCTSDISCSTSMEWMSKESSTTLEVSVECHSATITKKTSQQSLSAVPLSTSACSTTSSSSPGFCPGSYSSTTSSSSATTDSASGGYLTADSQNNHGHSLRDTPAPVPSPTTPLSPSISTSTQISTSASSSTSSLAVQIQNTCAFEGENDNIRGRRGFRGKGGVGDEEDDLGRGSAASSVTTLPSSSPESTVSARGGSCNGDSVGDPLEEKEVERKMEKQTELFKLFVEPDPGVLPPMYSPTLRENGSPKIRSEPVPISGPEERDITDFRGLIYTDSPLRELIGNAERARSEQMAEQELKLKRVNSGSVASLKRDDTYAVPPMPPLPASPPLSEGGSSTPVVRSWTRVKEQEKKESGTFKKAWRALTGRRER